MRTLPDPTTGVVALLDFSGSSDARARLQEVLRNHRVEVQAAGTVPRGPGIVALVLGPESMLSAADVAGLPDLRIVATTSTGYDHVPIDAVAEQGAWVTHVADYCTEEVADHTLALITGLLRGVLRFDRAVRRNAWSEQSPPPRRIAGTRVGLVGFGRTGRAVADRLHRVDARVLVHSPRTSVREGTAAGVTTVARLQDMLGVVDVLSLHLPLTALTRGLIDRTALSAMRSDAFLVNVSRGGLVEQSALYEALRHGHIAGAAVDVLEREPPLHDDPLFELDNLVVTPHVAWESPESQAALYVRAAGSVAAALSGAEPADVLRRPAPSSRPPTDPVTVAPAPLQKGS